MADAIRDPWSSARTMPGIVPPVSAQRHRSTVVPRRTSSAPDLRITPGLGSASASSGGPSTAASSSPSRPSSSQPEWRPHELHQPHPHITPLAPLRDGGRSRRPTSEHITATAPALEVEEELSQNMEVMARTLEELRRTLSVRQRRGGQLTLSGLWVGVRGLFGYGPEGTAARREAVSLVGKLLFGTSQIATTIALLCIAARSKSPVDGSLNEWQACERPLGIWCSIWCVRVVLGCLMAIWGYRRKVVRLATATERVEPIESPNARASHTDAPPVDAIPRPSATGRNHSRSTQVHDNPQISALTFSRLATLLTLLSLTWFITAHILTYTSVHTCRLFSPHLWWLTFGIICIGYLVIVEVIIVAFLVFIVGPLIFVFVNVILICMGRHPLRHNHINPEVGKLSHRAADRIPLVLYIPAPKETEAPVNEELLQHSSLLRQDVPRPKLTAPEPAHTHSYPPDSERVSVSHTPGPGTRVRSRSRRLFTFRRIRLKKSHSKDIEKGKDTQLNTPEEEQGPRYEDKWERGEYPFVKLEDNRAACAICLCDFDEPRRVRYSLDSKPPEDLDQAEKGLDGDSIPGETEGELRLADAGEGPQPLRLLDCAHVFHKTCLDPWLTEVSGRCPVCQKAVEVGEVPKDGQTSRWVRRRR